MRNFLTALLTAQGVPMLLMGDEYGHTKHGNNNTYCHDGEINWVHWDAIEADAGGLVAFTQALVRLRRERPELRMTRYPTDQHIKWHGLTPGNPDPGSKFVAFQIHGKDGRGDLYVAFNAAHTPAWVDLPRLWGCHWRVRIDTSKAPPCDAPTPVRGHTKALAGSLSYHHMLDDDRWAMLPYSAVVMESVLGEYPATFTQ